MRTSPAIVLVFLLLSACTQVPTVVTAPSPSTPTVAPSSSSNIQKVLDDFDRATLQGKIVKETIDREAVKTKGCIAQKELTAYPNQPPLTADCKKRLAALDAPKKQPLKP